MRMMACTRCLPNLRSRNSLAATVESCVRLSMPPALLDNCLETLRPAKVPTGGALSKSQAVFDSAMLVAFRQRHPLPEAYLWMWADSSPQATFDIFQTEMLALSKKESVDALLSAWNLASLRLEPFDLLTTMSVRDPLDAVGDVEGVVGPDDCLPLQSGAAAKLLEVLSMRAELALSLRSMLVRHINIPQMLASGNTTLEKKCVMC